MSEPAATNEQIKNWAHHKHGIPFMGPVVFPTGSIVDTEEWVYVRLDAIERNKAEIDALIARIREEQQQSTELKGKIVRMRELHYG
jgi:hypothetical protein